MTGTIADFINLEHLELDTSRDDFNLEERTLLITNMGPGSRTFAAAWRAFGYKAIAIPTAQPDSKKFSRKYVTELICTPLMTQVEDIMHALTNYKENKYGDDPNKEAAVFIPTAQGPCRFGKYGPLIRIFLDEEKLEGVRILSPTSTKNYQNIELPKKELAKLDVLAFKAMASSDILHNALLRTRPYEMEEGASEALFEEGLKELEEDIEKNKGKGLVKLMEKYAQKLKELPKKDERYPLILYDGEIFVRSHDPSTNHLIKTMEKDFKLESYRAPIIDWITYINSLRTHEFWQQKKYKKWIKGKIKGWWMNRQIKKFFKPFKDYLTGRGFHNPAAGIKEIQKKGIYHVDIEGESPLIIETANEFLNLHFKPEEDAYVCGIVFVGPFGCMQNRVAKERVNALVLDKRKNAKTVEDKLAPIIYVSYGESEEPGLRDRIAILSKGAYQWKDMMVRKQKKEKEMLIKTLSQPLYSEMG